MDIKFLHGIRLTWILWRYKVGELDSWLTVHLLLRGFKRGQRISLARAWREAAVIVAMGD